MIIRSAEFIISAVKPAQYPEGDRVEIALAGRSNVGKSSVINKLLNRRSLARTSSTPGKTQQLNYYLINDEFYFVDLPGYGFAKVPKTVKEHWLKMINTYLSIRDNLKCVLLLLDIRHAPSKEDQAMYDFLTYYQIPHALVVTKADKVARGTWSRQIQLIKQTLGVAENVPVFISSAETGQGIGEIWSFLEPILDAGRQPDGPDQKVQPIG
ncbi:MAG: YihA family ribosome biosis GTP-binding protein [Bacilli bacterium]|nr:YihA family ribosome biosis GTP-binding protein [Bacilli bacterium]